MWSSGTYLTTQHKENHGETRVHWRRFQVSEGLLECDLRTTKPDSLPFSWHHGLILAGSVLLCHALRFHWQPEETKHSRRVDGGPIRLTLQAAAPSHPHSKGEKKTNYLPVGQTAVNFHYRCLSVTWASLTSEPASQNQSLPQRNRKLIKVVVHWRRRNAVTLEKPECGNMVVRGQTGLFMPPSGQINNAGNSPTSPLVPLWGQNNNLPIVAHNQAAAKQMELSRSYWLIPLANVGARGRKRGGVALGHRAAPGL